MSDAIKLQNGRELSSRKSEVKHRLDGLVSTCKPKHIHVESKRMLASRQGLKLLANLRNCGAGQGRQEATGMQQICSIWLLFRSIHLPTLKIILHIVETKC